MSALGEQGVLSAWFDMTSGPRSLQNLGAGAFGMSSTTAVGAQGRVRRTALRSVLRRARRRRARRQGGERRIGRRDPAHQPS